MDLGYDVIVTITGIVLVFLILVLLMAIITLEGKIFDAMNGKKAAAKAASAAKPAAPVKQAGNATYTAKWTKVAASDDEDVPKTGDFASAPAALLASSVAFLGLGAFLTAESRKAKKNH